MGGTGEGESKPYYPPSEMGVSCLIRVYGENVALASGPPVGEEVNEGPFNVSPTTYLVLRAPWPQRRK